MHIKMPPSEREGDHRKVVEGVLARKLETFFQPLVLIFENSLSHAIA